MQHFKLEYIQLFLGIPFSFAPNVGTLSVAYACLNIATGFISPYAYEKNFETPLSVPGTQDFPSV